MSHAIALSVSSVLACVSIQFASLFLSCPFLDPCALRRRLLALLPQQTGLLRVCTPVKGQVFFSLFPFSARSAALSARIASQPQRPLVGHIHGHTRTGRVRGKRMTAAQRRVRASAAAGSDGGGERICFCTSFPLGRKSLTHSSSLCHCSLSGECFCSQQLACGAGVASVAQPTQPQPPPQRVRLSLCPPPPLSPRGAGCARLPRPLCRSPTPPHTQPSQQQQREDCHRPQRRDSSHWDTSEPDSTRPLPQPPPPPRHSTPPHPQRPLQPHLHPPTHSCQLQLQSSPGLCRPPTSTCPPHPSHRSASNLRCHCQHCAAVCPTVSAHSSDRPMCTVLFLCAYLSG